MGLIVVTGAAGFIGSCLLTKLHDEGFKNLVAVDDHEIAFDGDVALQLGIVRRVEFELYPTGLGELLSV